MGFIKSVIISFIIVFLIEGFFYKTFGIKEVLSGFIVGLFVYFLLRCIKK